MKTSKPQDSGSAKYLALIYEKFDKQAESSQLLEASVRRFPRNPDLRVCLFFSFMKEGKLLERQNVALALYKKTQNPLHALWAIESMYQIS